MPFGPCDCCGAERHVNRMTFAGELFGFYCRDCFDLYPDHDEPGGRHDIHCQPRRVKSLETPCENPTCHDVARAYEDRFEAVAEEVQCPG